MAWPADSAFSRRLKHLLDGAIQLQTERPHLVLLCVAILALPGLLLALRLDLKTDFAELLPQNKPSVIELHRVRRHLPSATTLSIVAKCPDTAALKRFVDTIAPRLEALGPRYVTSVDRGIQETRAFIARNKLLYAPYKELKQLHDEIVERYERAVGKSTGLLVDLEEDEPTSNPATRPADAFSDMRKRIKDLVSRAQSRGPHPEGYYLSEDRQTIVLLVKTPIEVGSLGAHRHMMGLVKRVLNDVRPKEIHPRMKIGFTGDFITGAEEYKIIKDDLTHVGTWGLLMILGVVLLFFLHLRTLVALTTTISVGLVWTFGFTELTVGHLNTSTGFLVSIVAGNGINFGIIYMARYLEARNRQQLAVAESIRVAHRDTWRATLAASAAAMCAYGSLAVTDFRGFKHFGIIGGAGMLLCWLATYLTTPVVLALSERISSSAVTKKSLRGRARASFGLIFAFLSRSAPRLIVTLGLLAAVIGAVLTVDYVASDPMEYNLRELRNVPRTRSEARQLSGEVDDIVGRIGQEGMAVLVDRVDQVLPLKKVLDGRRDAVPHIERPFDKVVTIFDIVPSRQKEKIRLTEQMTRRLRKARDRGVISDDDWAHIEEHLPKKPLRPIMIRDLPAKIAAPFAELDGTRGRIVYIVPRTDRSVWNARYLHTWADSYRETKLADGEIIRGSGRAVIFSDMLRAVREDAPKAILASLIGTTIIVLFTFGLRGASLVVLGTVVLGSVWLVAFMHLKGIKINFLNFVVFPITLGIGADYAINFVRRRQIEGNVAIGRVIVETGGAVVLCSMTTIFGYTALMLSTNKAIVSFGLTAVFGEVACLAAALLVVPSAMIWRARRRRQLD